MTENIESGTNRARNLWFGLKLRPVTALLPRMPLDTQISDNVRIDGKHAFADLGLPPDPMGHPSPLTRWATPAPDPFGHLPPLAPGACALPWLQEDARPLGGAQLTTPPAPRVGATHRGPLHAHLATAAGLAARGWRR